jgi:hypothetical protein
MAARQGEWCNGGGRVNGVEEGVVVWEDAVVIWRFGQGRGGEGGVIEMVGVLITVSWGVMVFRLLIMVLLGITVSWLGMTVLWLLIMVLLGITVLGMTVLQLLITVLFRITVLGMKVLQLLVVVLFGITVFSCGWFGIVVDGGFWEEGAFKCAVGDTSGWEEWGGLSLVMSDVSLSDVRAGICVGWASEVDDRGKETRGGWRGIEGSVVIEGGWVGGVGGRGACEVGRGEGLADSNNSMKDTWNKLKIRSVDQS